MTRRLYLDDGPGEARGVVTLDGHPERLLIARATDLPEHRVGARLAARVRRVDRPLASAFLDVGTAPDAVMPLSAGIVEGARLEVEIVAPPRAGKGAVARLLGPTTAEVGLIAQAPALADELARFAPGVEIELGGAAREAADVAEETVLAILHPLSSGGAISIEPTRALVAIDVDVGRASGDGRKAISRANMEALQTAARLLRLKGLGGPVVFDLAGKGHDGDALRKVAEAAFAVDQPGVAFGPITRFGLWPLTLPRRAAPLAERLVDREGQVSIETLAFRLLRRIENAAGPGARVEARAASDVAALADTLAAHLLERIGPRFHITADPLMARDALLVHAQ